MNKLFASIRSNIIGTNIVTKIHEDWKINVTSRVFTMKNAPPSGSNDFQSIVTIFELIQDIIETYILAKFYEDWNINFAHLRGFHDDWEKNVTSRVKTAPPTCGHVFQRIGTTFELNQNIIKTNFLTKLHDDWALNVTSTVFTRFFFFYIFRTRPRFHWTQLLTKFHEDGLRSVASRVLTSKCLRTDGRTYDRQRQVKKAHLSNQVCALRERYRMDEFVGSLSTRGAISLSPPQTPSTGSSQETDSTMPSCNIEVNVKLFKSLMGEAIVVEIQYSFNKYSNDDDDDDDDVNDDDD
ncbi:hypothetical protein DPMN_154610 [Dreissena polymorpha]|uniref:Uncharacterized protein n=1 Tax=Dreissena polymorpha TaxID=45954 RepID=A0A9D4FMC3_DREPO|nr:hypothetical protein DPMN_154610 [Dreissena polymorpha]